MTTRHDIPASTEAEELVDFTCATSWERLSLDIELEFRAWGVHDRKSPTSEIHVTTRHLSVELSSAHSITSRPIIASRLPLGDLTLSLELHCGPVNSWLHSYPLERLFGVHHYILLTSATSDIVAADNSSDAAILLSALCCAASSCACALPMFVPVGRPSSLRFIGRQLYPTHRRFSCDYTHRISRDHSHLAGLLALFQNKRASAHVTKPPRRSHAKIVAHFTYDWADFSFKLNPTPGSFASDRRLSAIQTRALMEADPVRRIRISAVWDSFPASQLQLNETLAAMPAATANRLRLSPASDLLKIISKGEFPSARIPMSACARANVRLAQLAAEQLGMANPAAPLPLVNMQKICAGSHDSARLSRVHAAKFDEYLVQVGEYVSAAAIQDDKIDEEFLTSAIAALFEMDLGRGIMVDVVDALGPNAAEMHVLERVARLMAVSESLEAAQKLWNLFLDGVQVHWEQMWTMSGVPFKGDVGPDQDASLVMQKLQMINCCVERVRSENCNAKAHKRDVDSHDGLAEGRKKILTGMHLIGGGTEKNKKAKGDQQIWEPFVQPHPLVTRDMVEEELQRMVLRAEASDRSDDMEAKRQSRTLRSDMMAFKAANPQAGLSDFVRWFSPSDWVVSEHSVASMGSTGVRTGDGRLSARMSRAGNIWQELFNGAEAMPARRQIPLFDAAAHGSKALADLRAMPVCHVGLHLAVVQSESACAVLTRAFSKGGELARVCGLIEAGRQEVRKMKSKLGLCVDGAENAMELEDVHKVVEGVAAAEHCALVATSVLMKLPPADGMRRIVDRLAVGEFVDVDEEKDRLLMIRMAGLDDGGWKNELLPEMREFVIFGNGDDEGEVDRMYARLTGEEFRVGFGLLLDYCV